MKRALWLFLFFALGLAVAQVAQQRRFDKLVTQENGNDDFVKFFEVWHDRDSGQEFTCAITKSGEFGSRPLGCFPTGRNWK